MKDAIRKLERFMLETPYLPNTCEKLLRRLYDSQYELEYPDNFDKFLEVGNLIAVVDILMRKIRTERLKGYRPRYKRENLLRRVRRWFRGLTCRGIAV